MNQPSYLSPNFPTRAQIRDAARLDVEITALRSRNLPIPPTLVRAAQHAQALFRNLDPQEQLMVSRTFNADIAHLVESVHVEVETRQEQGVTNQVNALSKELTQGMVGRPQGLTADMIAALRAGQKPVLKVNKLPVGDAADARVKQATGLTLKQYEAKLDEALVNRNIHKYTNPAKYNAYLAEQFPGQDAKHVDRLVANWNTERVGLEMKRRADKQNPDSVTMRAPTSEESRRLDLIESIAEHEGPNPKSMFNKSREDWTHKVASEEQGTLRGAIAQAFIAHDAADLNVSEEHVREHGTDEIVDLEDYDNG